MVLKTQTLAPLETIYEESGSFIASTHDILNQQNNHEQTNEPVDGLISSRSITPVHFQRQREDEKPPKPSKPPIEVQFRDGSKRYIHSSKPAKHRKKIVDSSHVSKESPDSNRNKKQFQSQPPLVITVISAEELKQANVSPTKSTSPSGSEVSISTSSSNKTKTTKYPSKIPIKQTTTKSAQPPVVKNYTLTLRSPTTFLQYPHRQQITANHHGSFTQLQSLSRPPKQLPTSSFQGTSNNDENEKKLSSNCNLKNTIKPSTTVLVGGGSRSAFRPFLKPVRVNQQPLPITPRVPLTVNGKPYKHPLQKQQQLQVVPYVQKKPPIPSSNQTHRSIQSSTPKNNALVPAYQYNPPVPSSNQTHRSIQSSSPKSNAVVPAYQYNTMLPTQNTSPGTNALVSMNSTNYQQQLVSSNNNSSTFPHILNISANPGETVSLAINPQLKWFNVTSNSLYEIPRLSTQYSSIPLRITLPVSTPTHNQRLVIKHDFALEKRLLNAGLSPETVALYERILDIAGNNRLPIISPPNIIDYYSP